MPQGGRKELIKNNVMITRSPVMHPGDVQVVNAVGVPLESPLRTLRNAVVFSQQGARDLPSMLSGGDLDGDLYNVIWDDRLVPGLTHEPADYPRVSAMELDRTVTRKDMSDFFVVCLRRFCGWVLKLTNARPSCRQISSACCLTSTCSLPTNAH